MALKKLEKKKSDFSSLISYQILSNYMTFISILLIFKLHQSSFNKCVGSNGIGPGPIEQICQAGRTAIFWWAGPESTP